MMEVIEKGQPKIPDVTERIRFGGDLLAYRVRYVYDRRWRMVEQETAGSVGQVGRFGLGEACPGRVVYVCKDREQARVRPPPTTRTAQSEKKLLSNMTRAAIGSVKTHLSKLAASRRGQPRRVEYRTITYFQGSFYPSETRPTARQDLNCEAEVVHRWLPTVYSGTNHLGGEK